MKFEDIFTVVFAVITAALIVLASINHMAGCDRNHREDCVFVQHFWRG